MNPPSRESKGWREVQERNTSLSCETKFYCLELRNWRIISIVAV